MPILWDDQNDINTPGVYQAKIPGTTKMVSIMRCQPIEHEGRWPCHCCGDKPDRDSDMYMIAIPWTTGHLDMTICFKCKHAITRAFVHFGEAK